MKKSIQLLLAFALFGQTARSQDYIWSKEVRSTGYTEVRASVTDDNNNLYTTGYFQQTTNFDNNVSNYTASSNGMADIFIQKHSPTGVLLWSKQIGGSDNDSGLGITYDTNGDIIVTGYFSSTVDFDPATGVSNLTSANAMDFFILKLNSNGDFIWVKSGQGNNGDDMARSVITDNSNNIYITGEFRGSIDFNYGTGTNLLTSNGESDIFIQKLDSNGDFIWAKNVGGTLWDIGRSIALDDNNNVFITGNYRETVDFDPGAGTNTITSNGINDVFTLKLNSTGNFVWAKSIGSTSSDFGYGIVIDNLNNVYTAGYYYATVDFDPNAGTTNLTSAGSYDVFIQKLDNNGNFVWAKSMGGSNDDYCWGLAIDNANNLYTTGYFLGTSDFDPNAGINNLVAFGNEDVFIQKLDENGNYIWAKSIGGNGNDVGKTISIDNFNNAYISGYYDNTMDIDPGTNTSYITPEGFYDGYILKLGTPCVDVYGTDVITACDSIVWIDGNTYYNDNSTAQYTLVGGSSNGCDSIVTLNLTINTVDITVTTTDPTITANTSTATSYKWLDCTNNFSVITGQSSQVFTATTNGTYAVEVTENGCVDTSNCVMISTVSINENEVNNIQISNQNDLITIFNSDLKVYSVEIYDLTGKLIYTKQNISTDFFQFSPPIKNQIIIVKTTSNNQIKVAKLNVQ